MNHDYRTNPAEDKATTESTTKIWLRKTLFNPRSYAMFIIICIIIMVIIDNILVLHSTKLVQKEL